MRASSGVAAAAALAGALHSVSLTHHDVPTNRSLTPRFLMHELGRHGDWHMPQRADFLITPLTPVPAGAAGAAGAARADALGVRGSDGDSTEDASLDDEFVGVDGEALIAVAAGRGLWAAAAADGSLLLCVHPCLRLGRVHVPGGIRNSHPGMPRQVSEATATALPVPLRASASTDAQPYEAVTALAVGDLALVLATARGHAYAAAADGE